MSEWKMCKIGDLCDTISDTYKRSDDAVVLINTSDVLEGNLLNHEPVPNKNLKGQFKKTFRRNDILYSEIRPANKRFAFIDFDDTERYIASTKLMVLRPRENVVLPQFLFAILKSQEIIEKLQHSAETRSGTFPQITFSSELAPMDIMIPDFTTQNQIVSILSSIEEKIKLNTAINENLEQQAQAIFKSWFVDFEPFGGVMPNDWNISTVTDLSEEIVCGKTPSTKKEEYYGNYMPFITIPDMHNCVYTISTDRYLSELGAKSQSKKTLHKNSICVSCIGTAGLVVLVAVNSQTNQQINSIVPKDNYSPYYIYLLMQTMSEKINRLGQSGSTIVNLNKAQFGIMEALVPSVASMNNFDSIVQPVFEQILANQQENQHLAVIRDTLLPKLMYGEIDVSNVKN